MEKRLVREIIERQYEESYEPDADPSPRLILELIERHYEGYEEDDPGADGD
jgi:hypothetical protein